MIASLLGWAMGDFAMLPDKRKSISSRPCAGEKKAPPRPGELGMCSGKGDLPQPTGDEMR